MAYNSVIMTDLPPIPPPDLFAEISPDGRPVSIAAFMTVADQIARRRGVSRGTLDTHMREYDALFRMTLGTFNQHSAENVEKHCRVIGAMMEFESIYPIVEIALPDNRGIITIQRTLFNTIISCSLERHLPHETFGLVGYFDPRTEPQKNRPEDWIAFPPDRVHGCFAKNTRQFTFTLDRKSDFSALLHGMCCVIRDSSPMPTLAPPPPETEENNLPVPQLNFGSRYKMKI